MSVSAIGAPPVPGDTRRREEAAWNWLQAQLAGRPLPAVLTIIGLGDLSILAALAARAPGTRLLALEPDAARARATLASRGLEEWSQGGRLIYLAGPDYTGADQAWRLFPTRFEQPPLIVHPESAAAPDRRKAMAVLAKIVFGVKANAEARRRFAPRYLLNSVRNLPAIVSGGDVRVLERRAAGTPAVVVGAGPSLDASFDELTRLQRRAVVIATDTSLRPLLARGITPQFVVALDPSEINGRHLLDLPAHAGTWLVAESALDPRATAAFHGRTLWFRVAPHQPWPWLKTHGIDVGRLDVWGSVLTGAYQVAMLAGCDPIVMVGADLSYPGGRPYVRGTTYEFNWAWAAALGTPIEETWRQQLAARTDIRNERDLAGVETPTSAVMLEFRDWLVAQARKGGRRHVNATGHGMLFGDGMEQGRLSEVLDGKPDAARIELAVTPPVEQIGLVSAALRAVSSRFAAGELEVTPLPEWREFSGNGFDVGQLADALAAASTGFAALNCADTGSLSSTVAVTRRATHNAAQWPEALWRLRCALAGDAVPAALPSTAARELLLVDSLDRLAAIVGEVTSADDLTPSMDPTPLGLSPAGASVTWLEPTRRAVLALEALLGEAWGRSMLPPAGFGFASGPIVCVDETPRSASARHELRPNATTGCLLLVLEWLRCAASLENGGALRDVCERVRSLLDALEPARRLSTIAGPLVELVVQISTDAETAHVALPLGVTDASLVRVLTGTMRNKESDAWELGGANVEDASIRVALRRTGARDGEGGLARSVLPRCPHIEANRSLTVTDQHRDGALCVVNATGETVVMHGDGSIVSHQQWPRSITGALSLGDAGDVAWSSGSPFESQVAPALMYRPTAAAGVEIIDLPFRPGRAFWWRRRLYFTCLPTGDAPGGVASWTPGERPRLLTTQPPLQGILPGPDTLLLQPYVMGPGQTVARKHPARVWSWSADDRGTAAPLGSFGASSGCAEAGGWTAAAYPQGDVIVIEHGDGRKVQLRCYNPVRVAWADGSLIVSAGHDEMLIFEHLIETIQR